MSNPLDEAVAGSVLGNQAFLRWVEDTVLSARPADPEIPDLQRITPCPSVPAIVSAVAETWQVNAEQIWTPGRKRNHARDVAIYLCREMSGLPCRELGRRFGGVSGAAITLRHDHLAHRMAKDPALTEAVTQIRDAIANS